MSLEHLWAWPWWLHRPVNTAGWAEEAVGKEPFFLFRFATLLVPRASGSGQSEAVGPLVPRVALWVSESLA